jgi:hypothetical protein
MDMDGDWRGSRSYMAEKGNQKLLTPDLDEPSIQDFSLVNELLELEAQNLIYITRQDITADSYLDHPLNKNH